MNSITTPLTKTLPYFAQPYALFGAILHISMLYLVLCIGKYSRTPLTLRPIQHHLYTIFLCVCSSAASVIIVAVNALHTCRAIPVLNFVGYFIVNATVPVCFGVVTGCEALHGRRKVLAERAGADAPERGTSALAVAFYAYATGLTFGLLNLVWLVSQHWSMPPMKAFIITTVLCSVIVGIVILVASQQTAAAIVRTDRARWWCAGMGAFIFGVLPFLMDTALAISAFGRVSGGFCAVCRVCRGLCASVVQHVENVVRETLEARHREKIRVARSANSLYICIYI
jgi:hypothetical protein